MPELSFELPDGVGEESADAGLLVFEEEPAPTVPDLPTSADGPTAVGRARAVVGESDTVVLWGFDGALALPEAPGRDDLVVAGPGVSGPVLVDAQVASRALGVDSSHAWLTHVGESIVDTVPDVLGVPRLEVVDAAEPVGLVGSLLGFLEGHPFVTALTLVHPALADGGVRAEVEGLLGEVGIRFLLISPDPREGVTGEHVEAVARFCAGGQPEHVVPAAAAGPVGGGVPGRGPAVEPAVVVSAAGESTEEVSGSKVQAGRSPAFAEFDQRVLSVSSSRAGRRKPRVVRVEDIDEF